MPRSFLIKRVEKVKTGYFPWNKEMLVQSCCLEYEVKNQEVDVAVRYASTLKIAQKLMLEGFDDAQDKTKPQLDGVKIGDVKVKGKKRRKKIIL